MVKNLPAVWEIWVRILGQKDPLEKGMNTHSSVLAWRKNPMDRGAWRATVRGVTELDMTEHGFRKVFLEVELGHDAPIVVTGHPLSAALHRGYTVYTRRQHVRVPVSTLHQHCLFCLLILKVRNISNWFYFAFQSLSVRLSINWNLFMLFSLNFLFISFSYFFLLVSYWVHKNRYFGTYTFCKMN